MGSDSAGGGYGRRGSHQPPGILETPGVDGAISVRPRDRNDAPPGRRGSRSRISIENLSDAPLPLVIGFHSWYQIPDCPRDQWTIHLPVSEHYELSSNLTPSRRRRGSSSRVHVRLPGGSRRCLRRRGSDQEFWVEGKGGDRDSIDRNIRSLSRTRLLRETSCVSSEERNTQRVQPGPRGTFTPAVRRGRCDLDRELLDSDAGSDSGRTDRSAANPNAVTIPRTRSRPLARRVRQRHFATRS